MHDNTAILPEPERVTLALIDGLQVGGKLRAGRVITLTRTRAEFAGDITLDQWQHGMRMLRYTATAARVWLADFISLGRQRFGEQQVSDTLVQLEFPQLDVNQALGIASLPLTARHAELSSEHLYVLAKAHDGDGQPLTAQQQEGWAEVAAKHGLTALNLQRSIEAGRVIVGRESSSRPGGLPTVHGFRQLFDAWRHNAESSAPITAWSLEQKRELWEELKAPVQVGLQLARDLGLDLTSLTESEPS